MITVDSGLKCFGTGTDKCAFRKSVKESLIRPGKPVENALAESFNSWLRDECLNTN